MTEDKQAIAIAERWENALESVNIDKIRHVAAEASAKKDSSGLSQRAGRFVKDLGALGVHADDPGEQAYFDVKKLVLEWRLENVGLEDDEYKSSKKSRALHWYRQSLKYGDLAAADRYLKKYLRFQGAHSGKLVGTLRLAHPFSGIPKIKRFQFKKSLSPSQRSVLDKATEWYRRTYLQKKRGQTG